MARTPARILLRACAALAAIAWTCPVAVATAEAPAPLQGVYEHCAPGGDCVARLQRMAADGLQVVINGVDPSDPIRALAYADAAQRAGMKVIWGLGSAYERYGATTSYLDLLAPLVVALRHHPATWGYYIGDEVAPSRALDVHGVYDALVSLDPTHPKLFVTCAQCGTADQMLRPFTSAADVLGEDIYPIFDGPIADPSAKAAVKMAAGETQQIADASGRESAIVLQAWRWQDSICDSQGIGLDPSRVTRFPTADELLTMRNTALLTARPKLVLWFWYPTVIGWPQGQRPDCWVDAPNAQSREAALRAAVNAPLPVTTAKLEVPASQVAPRRTVTLRGRKSIGRGGVVSYRWDTNGDGVFERDTGKAASTKVRFKAGGPHKVALQVTDGYGVTAVARGRVRVRCGRRAGALTKATARRAARCATLGKRARPA